MRGFRFTVENVNSGLGPTLTLIVGGLLWLLYLAPNLRDRAETRTIERDARRIAATTQELGILPKTPLNQMSAREIALHRRELERLARANDRHHERTERRAVLEASPRLAARYRTMKLALSSVILVAIGGAGTATYFAMWSYLVLATGLGILAVIGLVAVNTGEVKPPQRGAGPFLHPALPPRLTERGRRFEHRRRTGRSPKAPDSSSPMNKSKRLPHANAPRGLGNKPHARPNRESPRIRDSPSPTRPPPTKRAR